MVELADTLASGARDRKVVQVQLLSRAQIYLKITFKYILDKLLSKDDYLTKLERADSFN